MPTRDDAMAGDLYKALLDLRERDSQRFWGIFGVMSVINSGLFGIMTARTPDPPLNYLVPSFGLILCLIWSLTVRRMIGWIEYYEKRLSEVEPSFLAEINQTCASRGLPGLPPGLRLFPATETVTVGLSTRKAGWLLPLLFAIGWLAIFYIQARN